MLTALGYEVEAVGDGRSAEALLRVRSFDAMITDYLLPDLVGSELAGRAKARWPHLRVIMISGLGPEVIGSAVDLLLEKPFRIDQLVDALGTPAVTAVP
jgi:DNA-binding response OmpR family regulator